MSLYQRISPQKAKVTVKHGSRSQKSLERPVLLTYWLLMVVSTFMVWKVTLMCFQRGETSSVETLVSSDTSRTGASTVGTSTTKNAEIKTISLLGELNSGTTSSVETLVSSDTPKTGASTVGTSTTKNPEIKTISLLGERNSGTTWMLKELMRCYSQDFEILNHLTRHKHAFQYDDKRPHNQTLIVAEFRDPYQYILAMIDKPRKAISHRQMDWKTFVTTPWTTKREKSDEKHADSTDRVCQNRYKYAEVVPCEHDDVTPDEYLTKKRLRANPQEPTRNEPIQDIPLYEMKRDGSGEPFDSIVDLRAEKIRNHVLEVKEFPFVKDVVVVRYEDLLKLGTAPFHQEITDITGIKPHCDPTPPQPNRPQRPMKEDFKKWMDEHVDWDAEAIIGYSKY